MVMLSELRGGADGEVVLGCRRLAESGNAAPCCCDGGGSSLLALDHLSAPSPAPMTPRRDTR